MHYFGCLGGYWFFLTYCITNLVLAWSVQPPELPKKHEAMRQESSCKGFERNKWIPKKIEFEDLLEKLAIEGGSSKKTSPRSHAAPRAEEALAAWHGGV